MLLVDSHCHLHLLQDQNTAAVLQRAREKDVRCFLNITISAADVPIVQKACDLYPNVFCAVGVHPCEVSKAQNVSTEQIISWTKHPKVVAIGESGIDYFYESENASEQQRLFEAHIHAAQETGLPLVVHSRVAEQDTMKVLKKELQTKKFKAVLHCFSGSRTMAEEGLELGLLIGATGIITFKRKAEEVINIFKAAPLTQILIETDSPFLTPHPFRGHPNEPAYVYYTAQKLSELKNLTLKEVAEQTTKNFLKFCNRCRIDENLSQ